jgi:hypothetical protein
LNNNQEQLQTIQTLEYRSATNIRFSDHRPVSGLYRVAIKYQYNIQRLNRIRDELIREFDRLENDSIPVIEVYPRPPEIHFDRVRYFDQPTYSLTIKNIGECSCHCSIVPTSISSDVFQLTPNSPLTIESKREQSVQLRLNHRHALTSINEILILHVENGADTFITFDVTFDRGPFGLALDQYSSSYYNKETKEYVYVIDEKNIPANMIEMKNDPPVLFIALIDCLKQRDDIDFLAIFSNDTQDALNLIALRDQIYEHNYQFARYSSAQLFMILVHLLQALPQPLVSFAIQDTIFTHKQENLSRPDDMNKAVGILIERLQAKERNLFFRLLLLLQTCWPRVEQIPSKDDDESGDTLNVCIDIVALSILHEHVKTNQRRAFLLACLNDEKSSSST